MPTINPEVIPSNVKLNVTNMKTIFNGGGKGGAIIPKKGGALARSGSGALSTEKIFPVNDSDALVKRVAENEKKQVQKQIKNAQDSATPSIASSGSADDTNISTEDKIFNSLLGLDNNNNLFDS